MPPPPPPPMKAPPPPAPPKPSAATAVGPDDTAGALFAEIAALGENGLRSGLKKATRGPVNSEVPEAVSKPVPAPASQKANVVSGDAKCELMGKKWLVENQNGNKEITIEGTMKQTVYIYKCNDSQIRVTGKVNAIVLDTCVKTQCVFDEVMVSSPVTRRLF
jgi:adenylyl cyclase-associated protein